MFYDAAGQLFGVKDIEGDRAVGDNAKHQTANYYQYDGVGNVIRSRMAPADVTQPDQVDLYDTSQSTTPIFDTEDHDFITLPLVIDLGAVVSIVVRETGTSSIPKIALQSPSGIWQNFPDEDGDGTISIPTFVANERHLDATPWNPDGTRWKLIVYGPDDTTNNEFYLDVFVDGFSALGSIDYSYDLAGNLREVIESPNGPDSVPHDYDDDVSVGLGAITPYTYDALHRLTELRQSGTNVADKRVDFDYYDDSQFDTITRYSDLTGTNQVVASTYLYDDIGRLTDLQHAFGSTLDYGYSYDAAGRITQMTMPDASDNDYTYDNTNQLLTATLTNETYGYDDNGNRDTGGFTVDDNNRMDSDGTYTYAYDDEGNRTQRFIWADDGDGVIEAGEKSSITTYDWDHRNRLTEVTLPSGEVIDYTYDYQNRLVERDVTGGTADHAYYVHQGDNIALELDGLQSGDLTHRYLWGAAVDQLLADDQIGGELLWPLGDHEQTIRDVIDSSGQTRIHREYDSFGKIITETKYDTAGAVIPDTHQDAVDELFSFTGRMLDEDTGNQKHGYRWYDPPTGGWLSEDPIGFGAGDMNLYRYAGNNPVNNVDPSGLDYSGFASDYYWGSDYGLSTPSLFAPTQAEMLAANQFSVGASMIASSWADPAMDWLSYGTNEPSMERVIQGTIRQMGSQRQNERINNALANLSGGRYRNLRAIQTQATQDEDWMLAGYANQAAGLERSRNNPNFHPDHDILSRPYIAGEVMARAALEIGMGVVPVIGELQDFQTIVDPTTPTWQKVVSTVSLVANIGLPFLPNAGGLFRAGRAAENAASTARVATRRADAIMDAADYAPSNSGRTGRQARLRRLAEDPNVSSADRGWIKQEINQINRGKRANIRLPGSSQGKAGGKVLAHQRGKEARKGFGYEHSDLQDVYLHNLQHKHEGYR